ncbi:MAG TPA: aspartate kinase, partial [Roseiflexaceae bacterium]|nr:aspartate kinase [Roseiflexaceae bacterium]
MKFGAAAVGDAAQLGDLAAIVRAGCDNGDSLVVVCSALAGITDALIDAVRSAADGVEDKVELARRELWSRHRALAEALVTDEWEREALYREWADLLKTFDRYTRAIATLLTLPSRTMDTVAALGERFVAHLVAVILRLAGVPAQMIDAAELIVTDDHFGNARPDEQETVKRTRARLQPLMKARIVPVVTGYLGATRDGIVTTLGRGGGDYSATLIGAALQASEVCLWTDVNGILTADPKYVHDARTLPEISFADAAEIAALGAELFHPHTLGPVASRGITLHIRNIEHPDHQGTRVVVYPQTPARAARAVISSGALSLLSVAARSHAEDWGPALTRMAEANVEILSFTQSLSERSLTLAVRANDAPFARECLETALLANDDSDAAPHV